MMAYQWKPGTRFKADAQVAGERLSALIEENNGILEPAHVVEDAKPVNSPLHDDFEWDDSLAANEWREHTARRLIASVVVVQVAEQPKESPMPVRAFVNVREETRQGYTTTARAVNDGDLFDQIVNDALKAIFSYQQKLAAFRQYEKLERAFVDFAEALKVAKG